MGAQTSIGEIRGVLPIAPTPFAADGSVVIADVERLVTYYRACGVGGLTILGNASEVGKLSRSEIETLVREFLRCRGDLPVLVGTTSPSLTRLRISDVPLSNWVPPAC
jgi:4-hydroxy-tetrahydrodipicolinate synthase